MDPIGAIETTYDGYKFRSRTEARWAVFLNTLGVHYEYEKEGYRLPQGVMFLPDLWLPEEGAFIEIKGQSPTPSELWKAYALARLTCKPVYLFVGMPGEETILALEGVPPEWEQVELGYCPTCRRLDFNRSITTRTLDPLLTEAYEAARSARFEFGQTPVGPRLAAG